MGWAARPGDRADPDEAEGHEAGVEARRPRATEEADGRAGAEAGRARGGCRRRLEEAPKAKTTAAKKTTAKKPTAKKQTAKKPTAKAATAAKKPTAKKTTAKKPTAKKTTAKKPSKSEE